MENPHVPRKPIRRRRHCAHESSAEPQIKREQEADEEGNRAVWFEDGNRADMILFQRNFRVT
jgi:hypothetical protein